MVILLSYYMTCLCGPTSVKMKEPGNKCHTSEHWQETTVRQRVTRLLYREKNPCWKGINRGLSTKTSLFRGNVIPREFQHHPVWGQYKLWYELSEVEEPQMGSREILFSCTSLRATQTFRSCTFLASGFLPPPGSQHNITRCYAVYDTRKTMQELPPTLRGCHPADFLAARYRCYTAKSSNCGSQAIHHRVLKEGAIFLTANRFSHFLSIQWLKKNMFSCRYELSLWVLRTFFMLIKVSPLTKNNQLLK